MAQEDIQTSGASAPGHPTVSPGALAGVRVIECAHRLPGPFCGQLLADLGAEVIKIEDPGRGDPMRGWGEEKEHGKPLWWPIIGRNKKSVTCNLRMSEGRDILRKLSREADVLVENFRPGALERWGLGYPELAEINPGLILVRVTGFGQTGPYADRAGLAAVCEAMGGLRFLTGEPDRPPARTALSLGGSLAGTFAALGCLAALHSRSQTGCGQVVDATLVESILALTESVIPEWALAASTRMRTGGVVPGVAPSGIYETATGDYVIVSATDDKRFDSLTSVMGRAELAHDPRFANAASRGHNQEALEVLMRAWVATMPTPELLDLLESAGVPASTAYTAREMIDDPHFRARESITWAEDKHLGKVPMPNVAPRLSRTPGQVRWTGPELGAHNGEVLGQLLNIPDDEMERLRAIGAI